MNICYAANYKKKRKKKEKHNLNISTTLPLSLPRDLRPIYIAVECEDTVTYSIYIILKLTVNVLEALNKFYDFFSPQLFFTTENKQEQLNYYVLFCFVFVWLVFTALSLIIIN